MEHAKSSPFDRLLVFQQGSSPGILAYALHSTLKGEGIQPPPEKLSSRIPGFPVFKNRNPFQTQLKILGELFIEDVVRAPQLEKTFWKNATHRAVRYPNMLP